MEEKNLTDEQKKFLEECENQFKDRYTEKDIEFMKVKNMELKKPPIIDPWYPRRKRYFFPKKGVKYIGILIDIILNVIDLIIIKFIKKLINSIINFL